MEILHLVISVVALILATFGLAVQLLAPFNAWANIYCKSWQYHLMMFVFWVLNTISATINIARGINTSFNWGMVIFSIVVAVFYYYMATTKAKPDLDKQLVAYRSSEKLKNDNRPVSITREGEFIYEDDQHELYEDEEDQYYQR